MSVALNFSVDSEFTDKTSSSVIVNDLSRTTGKSLTDSTVIVTFAALLEPFALVILYENSSSPKKSISGIYTNVPVSYTHLTLPTILLV